MLIQARNLLDTISQRTNLTDNVNSAGTNSTVGNNLGMTTSWAVQWGATGEEQTEIAIGTASSNQNILHPALKFSHPTDTPVYYIKYDQIVFERSTAGTAGTATPMSNGTISIQADSSYTQFDDTSGTTTYAYKTYFRNSVLTVNSTESDWITPQGFAFDSLASMRQRVKDRLWNSTFLSDPLVDSWLNEMGEKMNNLAVSVNEDYSIASTDVAFSSSTELGTITASDFKFPRRVWVTYNGNDYFQASKMALNAYVPNQQFSSVSPYYYMYGDSVIGIKPNDMGGTARITYYTNYTPLVNDTDRLPLSMRSYSHAFISYCEAKALMKDSRTPEASNVMAEVNGLLGQFKSEIAPHGRTGNTYITTRDPIAGDDTYY